MKAVQLIISGRVQGVYFRAFTKKQAIKQGVKGYVCNKVDGSVEVIACAESKNLDPFINWCHKGPLLAKVKDVVINELESSEIFSQFEIR